MKRIFLQQSEYWRRLILSYLALTIVIIVAFGGYLTTKAKELHTKELSQENLNQLQRVEDFIEENYLNRYELSGLNQALATIRSTGPEEINYLLNYDLAGSYSKVRSLNLDLGTLKMGSPGLDSISFYFKRSNIVVDQDYFYESPENTPNRELLEHIEAVEPHRWFVRSITSRDGAEIPLLSYIYSLPYGSKGPQVKGYLIIDLSVRDMVSQLKALIQNDQDQYFLFTEQGQLAMTNTMQGGQEPLDWSRLNGLSEMAEAEGQTIISTYEGRKISLSAYKSSIGWTYVSLRPLESIALLTRELNKQIVVLSSFMLLIGIALSYFMSLGFHNRMQGIMQKLQRMTESQRHKSLYDLLAGRLPIGEEALPLPSEGRYAATLLQTDPPNTADLLLKRIESKMSNLAYYAVVMDSQRVAVVYGVEDEEAGLQRVREQLEELRVKLGREIEFAVAIGSVVEGAEHIHESYVEAEEALAYVFVYGMGMRIAYGELAAKQPLSMELLNVELLANKLKANDEALVHDYFEAYRASLRDANLTIEAYELILHHMALALARVIMDSGKGHFRLTSSAVIASYRQPSLASTLDHLETLSLEFMDSQRGTGESLYERLALSVKEYINDHLDQDLSLDELADYTSYSKQFICKVFKEQFECTVADYMSRRRLELARTLLSENSRTITEVAQMCGFRSVPYFTTKFKQFWGVTPAQFRNQ